MATHNEPEDLNALAHSEELGYETRDLPVAAVGKAGFWFFVFTGGSMIVAAIAMFTVYRLFFSDANPTASTAIPPRSQLPPPPLLQSNVAKTQDMTDMRLREYQGLTSYGWVDEEAGIARVPIEVAIDLTAQRGLPIAPMRGPQ